MWTQACMCLAIFLLPHFLHFSSLPQLYSIHTPQIRINPPCFKLWVQRFQNWNANCHQKNVEWHGKRWNRCWSVLWCAPPILDIHVIVNTLAVALLSSAWFLCSAISYVGRAFAAYQPLARLLSCVHSFTLYRILKPKCLRLFFKCFLSHTKLIF